jgi:hypothetical protein
LHTFAVTVTSDATRLGDVQTTRAPVELGRLPPLGPGQERALVLHAKMGLSTAATAEPLIVFCPHPSPGDE